MRIFLMMVFVLAGAGVACAGQEAIERGEQLYMDYGCALCHGKEGKGDGPNAKNSGRKPTNFHDLKAYTYGSQKQDIIYSIKNGIVQPDSIMPAYKHLTKQELEDITQYLMSLQQKD